MKTIAHEISSYKSTNSSHFNVLLLFEEIKPIWSGQATVTCINVIIFVDFIHSRRFHVVAD